MGIGQFRDAILRSYEEADSHAYTIWGLKRVFHVLEETMRVRTTAELERDDIAGRFDAALATATPGHHTLTGLFYALIRRGDEELGLLRAKASQAKALLFIQVRSIVAPHRRQDEPSSRDTRSGSRNVGGATATLPYHNGRGDGRHHRSDR